MKRFVRRYNAQDRELKSKAEADQRQADRLAEQNENMEPPIKVGTTITETSTTNARPSLDELWGLV